MGIAEELSVWLAQHPKKPSWDTQAVGEQALRNTPRGGSHRAGEGFSNPIWRGFMDNPIMPSHPAGTGRGLNIGAGEFLPPAAFMDYSQKFADQATNGDAGSAALSLGIAGLEATGLARPLATGLKAGAKYGPKAASSLWDIQTASMKAGNEPGMWETLTGYGSMQTAPQGVMNNGMLIYPGAKTWDKGQAKMRKNLQKKFPNMSEAELVNRTHTMDLPHRGLTQERPEQMTVKGFSEPSSVEVLEQDFVRRDLEQATTAGFMAAINGGSVPSKDVAKRAALRKRNKAYIDKYDSKEGIVNNFVKDSSMVQNFPESRLNPMTIKSRGIPTKDGLGTTRGYYDPETKEVISTGETNELLTSNIAHEESHLIDDKKGFHNLPIDEEKSAEYSMGVGMRVQQGMSDIQGMKKEFEDAKVAGFSRNDLQMRITAMQDKADRISMLVEESNMTPYQRYRLSEHEMMARRASYVHDNKLTQGQLNYTDTLQDWLKAEEKREGGRMIYPEPGQIEYDPGYIRGIDF